MYHHECVFSVSLLGAQIVEGQLALQSLSKYWALRVRPTFFTNQLPLLFVFHCFCVLWGFFGSPVAKVVDW